MVNGILNGLDIFCIVVWLFAGIATLASPYKVTKLEYGLCWGVLMLQLFMNLVV